MTQREHLAAHGAVWLLASSLLCYSNASRADTLRVSTEPDSAGVCPDAPRLTERLDRLLGGPGEADRRMRTAGITLDVRLEREGPGHAAAIELSGLRSGRRKLVAAGADCSELFESLALALAILIDPAFVPPPESAAQDGRGSTATQRAWAVAGPSPSLAEARIDSPMERNAEAELGLDVWAGAGPSSRVTRAVEVTFAGGFDLQLFEWLSLRPGLFYVPWSRVELEPGGVEVRALGARFDACFRPLALGGDVRLAACGGALVGRIEGRARGFTVENGAGRSFPALDLGLLLDVRLTGRLGFWLEATTLYPLVRHAFQVTGAGTVYPLESPAFWVLGGPKFSAL